MTEFKNQSKQLQSHAGHIPHQLKAAAVLQDNRNQVGAAPVITDNRPAQLAVKPNNTGLPNQLKAGIESLSGMSMDHVKVHYNSSQPAQLNAHAYAQGSEIHVAPGQEKHLPHEAWHVVQQAQGRVKPTMQMKFGVQINDDGALEQEADVMGARANSLAGSQKSHKNMPASQMKCKKCETDKLKKVNQLKINTRLVQLYTNCHGSDHNSSVQEKAILKHYQNNFSSNTAGEMALNNGAGGWAFADIVDIKDEEVYEIKTVATGAAQATAEAKYYLGLLKTNCAGTWTLGRSFKKQTIDLGYFGNMTYSSPGNGAIIYELNHV